MSLAGISPLIADWMRLKLNWSYLWQPQLKPFTISAGTEVHLPHQDFIYKYPEGILLTFGAAFDHPNCGIRFENPQIDTGRDFTVNALLISGLVNQPWYVSSMGPPQTPVGIYGIAHQKEWAWTDWARLYVFNSDTIPHTCIGVAYTLAVLKEPRPDDSIVPLETMKRIQLAYEMYPEAREGLRKRLADQTEEYLKELGVKKVELGAS
jgi:hypothetical protein